MTTILVVEDNALTRKVVRLALTNEGYTVLEALDGASALALAARGPPALILMDLGLPDFDGPDLLRWLRAVPGVEGIPILAMSGALPPAELMAGEGGFTDVLLKPVTPSRLVSTIASLLRQHTPVPGPGRRRRVLLVDDDPVQRRLLRLGVASWGYEVAVAVDGAEALRLAQTSEPEVIVTDLLMPELDGLGLAMAVRSDRALARVPVVLVSPFELDEIDLQIAHDAGVTTVVSKSPSLTGLRAALESTERGQIRPPSERPAQAGAMASRLVARLDREAAQRVALEESQAVSTALLAFFGRYSRLVMHGGDPDDMVDELLAGTLDASGASCGAAYLAMPDGSLVLRGQIGYPDWAEDDLARCFGVSDLLKEVLAKGTPIELPSKDYEITNNLEALLECAQATALVMVPLALGSEPIGILVLGAQRPAPSSHRLRMAEAIRGPIAQAVALSRTLAELVSSRQLFRGITESASDGILVAHNGVVTYANPAAGHLFGCSAGRLGGRAIDRLYPFLGLAEASAGGSIERDDGSHVPVTVTVGSFEDASGQLLQTYVARDLSLRHTLDELAVLANRDWLTELFNRRWFEEHLGSRLAEADRYAYVGALVLIDLDDFKPVNDAFGHSAGDAVLKRVGVLLVSLVRQSDAVARVGGDEFALDLPHIGHDEALTVANKLLTALAEPIEWRGTTLQIGASIGVAIYPEDGQTSATLFEAADRALYRAKNMGRNRVCGQVES